MCVWCCRILCNQNCISRLETSSRIQLQRNTILKATMQLHSILIMLLALSVQPAAADDSAAVLWNQALQYHGWSTMHSREPANVQCHQIQIESTDTKLHKTGFHGDITYTVDLPQAITSGTCNFTVLHLLPAGIYADPYELQNLVITTAERRNGRLLSSFKVFGLVDVEKIETDCGQTLLSVSAHYAGSQTQTASCNAHMRMEVTVPLHARYPAPKTLRASGFSTFLLSGLHDYNIAHPLFRVEHASGTASATPRCYSSQTQQTSTHAQQYRHWTVPTGAMWHMQLVEIVTIVAAACSLCVLLSAIFCNGSKHV